MCKNPQGQNLESINTIIKYLWIDCPRKITNLGESLAESQAYNPIQDSRSESVAEILSETLSETFR